jgi:hypothetical protein
LQRLKARGDFVLDKQCDLIALTAFLRSLKQHYEIELTELVRQ